MSIFTRRNYVWLASAMRDQVHMAKSRTDLWDADECARLAVFYLADALEAESPMFDKATFLHNVFCDPTAHTLGLDCPFIMAREKAAAE